MQYVCFALAMCAPTRSALRARRKCRPAISVRSHGSRNGYLPYWRVRISVTDNGVGIPRENLTGIFNHGFTTKKNGHGFGLHSGALAVKELGGSIYVQSDGAGTGATFTIELPLTSEPVPVPEAQT